MASKHGGTKLQSREKDGKLWCSKCKEYHFKRAFARMKTGCGWQGWCKKAMRESVRKWKAAYQKRTGEIYG